VDVNCKLLKICFLDFDAEEMGNLPEEKGLRKGGDKDLPSLYRNPSSGILLENSDPNSYDLGKIMKFSKFFKLMFF
jgi:hypothetical protein